MYKENGHKLKLKSLNNLNKLIINQINKNILAIHLYLMITAPKFGEQYLRLIFLLELYYVLSHDKNIYIYNKKRLKSVSI